MSTLCNASEVTLPDGTAKSNSPLHAESVIYNDEPFCLSSTKAMVRFYPRLTTGENFQLQLGTGTAPATVTIFNGKDWDTGDEVPNKRALMIRPGDDICVNTLRELHKRTIDLAVQNAATWFPKQPNITRESIEALLPPIVRETEYGPEVRCDFDTAKSQCYKHADDGSQLMTDFPRSTDANKPVHHKMLLTCEFYVWIKAHRNGKRYESMGIKFVPARAFDLGPGGGGGGGAAPTMGAADVTAATLAIGPLVDGQHRQYAPVLCGGERMSVAADYDPGDTSAASLLEAKLWPEFNASSGPATTIQFQLPEDSELLRVCSHIEDQVLARLREDPHIVGATSVEDIDDSFVPLVRNDETYGKSIRVKAVRGGAGSQIPMIRPGGEQVTEVIHVVEGNVPTRVRALPLQYDAGISVGVNDGRLESVTVALYVKQCAIASDDGAAANGPAAFDGLDVPQTKRIKLSA